MISDAFQAATLGASETNILLFYFKLQEALEDAELSSLASKLEHDVIAVIADDDHTFV